MLQVHFDLVIKRCLIILDSNCCILMKNLYFHFFPRDAGAGNLLEYFWVSAVSSILIIRLFLVLTDFPQLGGEKFHIAHVLWGGAFMFVALTVTFIFLNRETKYIASVIGGIGFGAFIDELGKFITHDNNYFFQPAIAIIYVILVLIFLASRGVEKYFHLRPEEYAINALEMTKQALMHNLDEEEKKMALRFLKKSDPGNPIVKILEETLDKIEVKEVNQPNLFHKLRSWARKRYFRLIKSRSFKWLVINFFIAASVINFLQVFLVFRFANTFAEWGQLIFSFASGLVVIAGIFILVYKRSRKKAYEVFKVAVLISIFLTQFFLFLEEQLSAVAGLIFSLVIYNALQYSISQEEILEKEK